MENLFWACCCLFLDIHLEKGQASHVLQNGDQWRFYGAWSAPSLSLSCLAFNVLPSTWLLSCHHFRYMLTLRRFTIYLRLLWAVIAHPSNHVIRPHRHRHDEGKDKHVQNIPQLLLLRVERKRSKTYDKCSDHVALFSLIPFSSYLLLFESRPYGTMLGVSCSSVASRFAKNN